MTSPKQLKYWRKNIKIKYMILFGVYCYFICIRKIARLSKLHFRAKKMFILF